MWERWKRRLAWTAALGVGLLLLEPLLTVAYGLATGKDVAGWWRAWRYELPAFTIDPARLADADTADPTWMGDLENEAIVEVSGLAPSRRRDGVLWALNDSHNPAVLHAIDERGRDLGAVALDVPNRDWEDLASFEQDGQAWLVVADVGDNLSWMPQVTLYFVPEPEVPAEGLPPDATARVALALPLRYEDGPRDVEAVDVDPVSGLVLLVGKRTAPAPVYELPLPALPGAGAGAAGKPAPPKEPVVARRIALLESIPQPTERDLREDPEQGQWRSEPTALTVRSDGRAAVVMTYKDAYRFRRAPDESWGEAFARIPERIRMPPMVGAESIAYDRAERALFVSSEELPAPLFRVEVAPRASARAP